MSKPILAVQVATLDEKAGEVRAVFDTGAFYSMIRADKVPEGAMVLTRRKPLELRAAAQGSKLTVTGELSLILTIDGRMIEDAVMVSPNLAQEMLVGAKTMQAWDISVVNHNGHTEVRVGRDMRDPDVMEVD